MEYSVTTVRIWGHEVGAAIWLTDRGHAAFEYSPSFLKLGLDLSPVHMSTSKALVSNHFEFPNLDKDTFHGLPGLLANSLPDNFGNAVINNWLRKQSRRPDSLNPVELLSYIGSRGMGALEFEPCSIGTKLDKTVEVYVDSLRDLAQRAIAKRHVIDFNVNSSEKETKEAMDDIMRVGTSAGGAVPKAIIALNEEGHMLSGQGKIPDGYEHFLLKFDNSGNWNEEDLGQILGEPRVEYAYFLMAKASGIKMMECKLLEENGRAHFLTKRFDRVRNERLHSLNLASLGHFGFNPMWHVGYEDTFDIMRNLKIQYPEREEQFRRMVFKVLARVTDDHVKNDGFLMAKKGEWHLSPAYDLTYTYDPDGFIETLHQMTVNGKNENICFDDLMDVADYAEINNGEDIIGKVAETVSQWSHFAQKAGVTSSLTKEIGNNLIANQIMSGGPKS